MTYGYARVSNKDKNEVQKLTLLERHRRNQRRKKRRLKAAVQAYIDRQARKIGACLHCPWHSAGAACVLPRCLNPEPYKEAPDDLRG